MTYIIVSNNSRIKNRNIELIYCKGFFEDVLKKARDLVYKSYKLEVSPLPASHRMLLSPVRSLVLSKVNGLDQESIYLIEKELEKYQRTMGIREPDIKNLKDYELVDEDLLLSALEELGIIEKY